MRTVKSRQPRRSASCKKRWIAAPLCICSIQAAIAGPDAGPAGDELHTRLDLSALSDAEAPFQLTWQLYGSAIFGDSGKGEAYAIHAGIGFPISERLSISIDLLGGYIDSEIDDNGVFGGVDVFFRTPIWKHDAWTLYFDGGVGFQQQSTNFAGNRHFNFRAQLGPGVTIDLNQSSRIILGARYIHISDAGIKGGGGGYDGPIVYGGLQFSF